MSYQSKYLKKLEHQKAVNPGHKESYIPLNRGRATVFSSKKEYNRRQEKLKLKNGFYD